MLIHQPLKALIIVALLAMTSGTSMAEESESNVDLSKETPSATLEISQTSVRLLVGGSWGSGTLHYNNMSYPFKIKGLSAGGIGVKTIDAVGKVYFLNKVEDFEGNYGYRSAGATAYKGQSRSTFDNKKGVIFTLDAKNTGLALSLGVGGVSIEFEK
ncbi:hypothetical protein [Kaarinaea lacus]